MKLANDVLEKMKGAGNVTKTMTGKGSFSRSGFADLVNALANDTTFKVKTMGKDGKVVEVSISQLIRGDHKRTAANVKYPQKSEVGVYDTGDIYTNGLAEAIPYIVLEQIRTGRKFTLPSQTDMVGDIYLAPVAGKTKTVQVRDIKTKEELGTTTIVSKDSVQVRAKSPVPKHLQTKTRRDKTGKIVTA